MELQQWSRMWDIHQKRQSVILVASAVKEQVWVLSLQILPFRPATSVLPIMSVPMTRHSSDCPASTTHHHWALSTVDHGLMSKDPVARALPTYSCLESNVIHC